MTYDISLDKKKAILLGVGCILIVVLSFLAGLFAGVMMQLPKTPEETATYAKPAKAVTKPPAVLAKKLPAKPKVKLPAKPRVKLPVTAKKPVPTTPAAASATPSVAAPAPPPAPPWGKR